MSTYEMPDTLVGVFRRSSFVPSESADAYALLYEQVTKVAEPKNVLEQMWVSDVVNHFWASQRIRRSLGALISSARRQALVELLTPMLEDNRQAATALAARYFGTEGVGSLKLNGPSNGNGADPERPKQLVDTLLRKHSLDERAIDAVAMQLSLKSLTGLEDLAHKHELRREAILREFECRRAKLTGKPGKRTPLPSGADVQDLPEQESPPLATDPA